MSIGVGALARQRGRGRARHAFSSAIVALLAIGAVAGNEVSARSSGVGPPASAQRGTAGTGGPSVGSVGASSGGRLRGAARSSTSAASKGPAIAGLEGPWRLVMDDEFNARSLDGSLWHTCYDWGCTIATNPEDEWYEAADVAEKDGELVLTAKAQPAGGRDYTSGMVQSNGNFDFTYGVIEVRAKVPAGVGSWPAIWLLPANGSWPPEIDIMELWGDAPSQVRLSFHYAMANDIDYKVVDGPDFAARFHTFAVNWEPGSITWYLDGKQVYQVGSQDDELMYPIVNLAVADPPSPAPSTFPARFDIDWIRVYQHPGTGVVSCPGSSCVP